MRDANPSVIHILEILQPKSPGNPSPTPSCMHVLNDSGDSMELLQNRM